MKLELLEGKPSESIKDYAYRVLRKSIIDFDLKPGEAITENEIAGSLNVSRTPVREAFGRLVVEGLLEVFPQKGTHVSLINIENFEEAQFMRLSLEKSVIRLACEDFPKDILIEIESNLKYQKLYMNKESYVKNFDLDNEMHQLIFKGCRKERVWEAIYFMNADFDRIRTLDLLSSYDWSKNYVQHKGIIKAIKDKNPDMGEKLMNEHLSKVNMEKKVLIEQYPEYFI